MAYGRKKETEFLEQPLPAQAAICMTGPVLSCVCALTGGGQAGRVSSRFEERKISEPGWDVLDFRLRSYRTRSSQSGGEHTFRCDLSK